MREYLTIKRKMWSAAKSSYLSPNPRSSSEKAAACGPKALHAEDGESLGRHLRTIHRSQTTANLLPTENQDETGQAGE